MTETPAVPPPAEEPGKPKRRGLAVGTGLVIAGLIGGGAFAATQVLSSSDDQPDSVLPATAAMYARFDLDPSAGQKIAAVRFLQGLDEDTKNRLEDGQWREWAWEQLATEGHIPDGVDYGTDIEPWLGDRAGAVLIPDGDAEPFGAVAIQVKDGQGQVALDALDKIVSETSDGTVRPADSAGDTPDSGTVSEPLGYYVAGDYVVLTLADQVDQVQDLVADGTLADHDPYVDDMAELGDPGVASVWVDGQRLAQVAPALAASVNDPMLTGPGFAFEDDLAAQGETFGQGRVAATVRLSPDAIELHGIARTVDGGWALPVGTDTAHLVNTLPGDTAAVLSMENGAETVKAVWDVYEKTAGADVDTYKQVMADVGVTLPDDLYTVLGESMVLAVGPGIVDAFEQVAPTDPNVPTLPVVYQVDTDTDAVSEFVSGLGGGPGMVPQRSDDGVFTIGLDQEHVDQVASRDGDLGESALFKAAVPDPESTATVFFVNVNPFEQYYLSEIEDVQVRDSFAELGAVGVSTTVDSDTQSRFTVRFVADEE